MTNLTKNLYCAFLVLFGEGGIRNLILAASTFAQLIH